MYYAAIDKWNNGDSLAHYKYIKKIKIGPFTRYFYSMKDLQAYYKNAKKQDTNEVEKYMKKTYDEYNNFDNDYLNGRYKDPSKAMEAKNTLEYENQLAKGFHKGKMFRNKLETGKFFISNLLGSGSKKKLILKEKKHYSKNREITRNFFNGRTKQLDEYLRSTRNY